MIFRIGMVFGLALVVFANAGCSTIDVNLPWQKSIPEASAKHPVIEVMALWQPGEGRGLDHLPTRGFAGQILFFASGIESPVKVDGDITVYVFDDAGTREEQKKPIHEFHFDAGSWNSYFQETNFGPAYQVFIPYTRRGSHQANCALRIKFQPKSGTQMFSDVANVVLKGEKKPDSPTKGDHAATAAELAIKYTELDPKDRKLETSTNDENQFSKLNTILQEAKMSKKSDQLGRLEKLLESTESTTGSQSEHSESRQPRMLPNQQISRDTRHILESPDESTRNQRRHPLDVDSF